LPATCAVPACMVKVPVRTPFELRQIEPVDEAG